MISNRKELHFYIKADRMMNRGCFSFTLSQKILNFFVKDNVINYLYHLRKYEYYKNKNGLINRICCDIQHIHEKRIGEKLGFSIAPNVFGYGLVIPHHGTIVVGEGNIIGNYSVLHTSTCITAGNKKIGNGLYLSTGAKIVQNNLNLGHYVLIAANSVVNSSFSNNGILLAGMPAVKKKVVEPWYIRDGEKYRFRVEECEKLHKLMTNQFQRK